jgi:hypothetical protein
MRATVRYIPQMPNVNSARKTPVSVAIDGRYCALLLNERWNWGRFVRLCQFVEMTPEEVASIVMMPHRWLRDYEKNHTLPDTEASRPIALLLTILENHWMGKMCSDVISDPFPEIGVKA